MSKSFTWEEIENAMIDCEIPRAFLWRLKSRLRGDKDNE